MYRKTKKPKHAPNEYDKTKPWFWSYYSREHGWVRRMTRRKDRHNAKAHIARGRDDLASKEPKSTGGWISY